MRNSIILAIAQKDWKEVRQNPSAWAPMLIIPLVFVILMPLAIIFLPSSLNAPLDTQFQGQGMANFFNNLPPAMSAVTAGLNPLQTGIVLILGYLFAPFFLIIPLMFSTVIASESFAGEYERKTIEALFYSAASDSELFLGKVLAAVAPAVAITLLSFGIYTLVVGFASYPLIGRWWFPLPSWYPLIFWISPAISLAGVALTVLISAKVKTFMGTYQASASSVLLVLALLIGQVSGVLYLSVEVGLILGAILWVSAIILTGLAVRSFDRRKLLASVS